MSTLRKKLESPVALVIEGFVAGCILFWAVSPARSEAQNPVAATQTASDYTVVVPA